MNHAGDLVNHAGDPVNHEAPHAPRAARDRLRALRGRSARRDRVRRRALAAGALTLLGALGWTVVSGALAEPADAEGKPLIVPAHAVGEQRTAFGYGDPNAPHVLTVRFDPRDPRSATLERELGSTVRELADKGAYRIEYHGTTLQDGKDGGRGSARALNALGAAAEQGPKDFAALFAALAARPAASGTDGAFAEPQRLMEIADEAGVRTPAFDRAVTENTYAPWVAKATGQHNSSGTSDVLLDGRRLHDDHTDARTLSAVEFRGLTEGLLPVARR
ncbi:thioredoxin domain-containing protein [Streptomyces sp. NPDC087440]|uniref:thioredoxin domain-containing protein n=1 Tax=Streptomyces sp. NPDC087440 TaxID=3365790 RepID=UPI0037F99F0D